MADATAHEQVQGDAVAPVAEVPQDAAAAPVVGNFTQNATDAPAVGNFTQNATDASAVEDAQDSAAAPVATDVIQNPAPTADASLQLNSEDQTVEKNVEKPKKESTSTEPAAEVAPVDGENIKVNSAESKAVAPESETPFDASQITAGSKDQDPALAVADAEETAAPTKEETATEAPKPAKRRWRRRG